MLLRIILKRFSLSVLFLCVIADLSAFGQLRGISGTVVDEHGFPIAGTIVYGSPSYGPNRSDVSTTDKSGRFHIDRPGTLLHVRSEGFQPRSIVLRGNEVDLQIALRTEAGGFHLAKCRETAKGEQLLGSGIWGVRVVVPERGVRVSKSEDVDYVSYDIRVKSKGATLELWFGPTAFSPDPDDKILIASVDFSQRSIFGPDGKVIGIDSQGRTSENRLWRHAGGFTDGASYDNASPEEAVILNRIIESMCIAEDRKKNR